MANRFWVGGTGTWDATVGTKWSATSGGTGGASIPTAADDVYFDANSGGGTVTVNTATRVCLSLSFKGLSGTSNFTGTFAQSGTGSITISGGLILSASTTYTYAGAITFNGVTSFNVTSNGVSLSASTITINGAGLTLTCTDAFVTTGSFVMTQGSINGSTISVGSLTITSNSLTRSISFDSMSFTGSGTLATIGATQTNLSFIVSDFYITGAQASARTLATTGVFYANNQNVYLTGSGAGSISFTSGATTFVNSNVYISNTGGAAISLGTGLYNNIIFQSGTNTVWSNAASQTLTVVGNVTLTSTQGSNTLTPAITLNGSIGNSQTITSAGKSFVTGAITISDTGNSVAYTFADAFSSNAAVTITATGTVGVVNINANFNLTGATNTLTLTAGNLSVKNGANVTCGVFSSSGTSTRTLNMGSGTWTITGTGTCWNLATSTGMTLNAEQSRILMNNTSATACGFSGGSLTYYTLELAKGSSTATTTISGSNTFANFIDNTSTAAHTITFASSTTSSFYRFNVRGTAGNLITMNRPAAPTPVLAKLGKGIVCYCDYITLGNLTPSPATNTWYIGANSSIGTSVGFIATDAPSSQSVLGIGGVG